MELENNELKVFLVSVNEEKDLIGVVWVHLRHEELDWFVLMNDELEAFLVLLYKAEDLMT